MDIGIGLTILGGGVASKEMVKRVLGPTADYIGEEIKLITERRLKAIGTIFKHASNKLDRHEHPGAVSPRILKGVLEEGSFVEDDLTLEYFGGVLASSKADSIYNDQGVALISTLNRLTSLQVRVHYVVYQIFVQVYRGSPPVLPRKGVYRSNAIYIPDNILFEALNIQEEDDNVRKRWITQALTALSRELLIGVEFLYTSTNSQHFKRPDLDGFGYIIVPSVLGLEFFASVFGLMYNDLETTLQTEYEINPGVVIHHGSVPCPLLNTIL